MTAATLTYANAAAAIARSEQAWADVMGMIPAGNKTTSLWKRAGADLILRGPIQDQVNLTVAQWNSLLTVDELATAYATKPTNLMAHRGFLAEKPQNTMAAFAFAVAQGASILECDVQPSADGVLYLFHDDTVNGLTEGDGTFTALQSAYIDTLHVQGELLAKFSDFIAFIVANNIPAWPEIKAVRTSADIDAMVAASVSAQSLVTWQSFNMTDIERVRVLNQTMGVALAIDDATGYQAKVDALAVLGTAHLFAKNTIVTTEMVDYCGTAGVGIAAWNVGSTSAVATMVSRGVTNICSDYSWWSLS